MTKYLDDDYVAGRDSRDDEVAALSEQICALQDEVARLNQRVEPTDSNHVVIVMEYDLNAIVDGWKGHQAVLSRNEIWEPAVGRLLFRSPS